jgi:hypothetical protein
MAAQNAFGEKTVWLVDKSGLQGKDEVQVIHV